MPHFKARYESLISRKSKKIRNIACPDCPGVKGRHLLGVVDDVKLRRILSRMLDENEFLGPHGIRSLSRFHADHPYLFNWNGVNHSVGYLPSESDSGLFGGNSNWRGPVWMPANFLILGALHTLYTYYGDTGAGIGASHQTGWTGLLAPLLTVQADLTAADLLEGGIKASLDI